MLKGSKWSAHIDAGTEKVFIVCVAADTVRYYPSFCCLSFYL